MNHASKTITSWFEDTDFNKTSSLKQDNLEKIASKKTLDLFHRASVEIPAYKDFLKYHKINSDKIKTITDYSQIPPTTKENYIQEYPLHQRVWKRSVTSAHMISSSSGTSGEPHFWPRDLMAEIEGAFAHEYLFEHVLKLGKTPTLFINGFALGNWIAGTFTHACTYLTSMKNFNITSTTPGYSAEDILSVLHGLKDYYDRVIIAGHSPFLKEIVEEVDNQGIKWDKTKLTLLGTGQAISEQWRDYLLDISQNSDPYHSIINLYGSADAALMGIETPLSIWIRRLLQQDRALLDDIVNSSRLPSLYQYDPRLTYFQVYESELLITKYSTCPLIRYNIKDVGGLYSYHEMTEALARTPFQKDIHQEIDYHQAELPFVYLFGRDKFMVKIYGANIYTEHVQHALNHLELQPYLTGRFKMESSYDEAQNPLLVCHLEGTHAKPIADEKLIDKICDTFVNEVRKLNSEYDFVLNELGDKVKPIIKLYHKEHPDHFTKSTNKVTKNA